VLVQVDGQYGTSYGDSFPAVVEPVDAGDEGSLQLLNEAKKKSYKQMKEGTSDHDAAQHAYWQSKMIARLADTEARACIDDIAVVSNRWQLGCSGQGSYQGGLQRSLCIV
jgi:hypothetical protein